MRIFFLAVPALIAGCSAAERDSRPNALDSRAKAPPIEFRSAFEGYRAFADQDLQDWRQANEEVGAAGGHAGHRPGHGAHK